LKINIDKFSHILRTAIIAESATVVWDDCVVQNEDTHTVDPLLHANGTGTFF